MATLYSYETDQGDDDADVIFLTRDSGISVTVWNNPSDDVVKTDSVVDIFLHTGCTALELIELLNANTYDVGVFAVLPNDSNGSTEFGILIETELTDNGFEEYSHLWPYVASGAILRENVRAVYRAGAKIVPTKSHREVRTGTGSAYQCLIEPLDVDTNARFSGSYG